MKTKKYFAVDLDGVLADFEEAFCERFGDANRHLFNLEERYPQVPRETITEFVGAIETYLGLSPIFGGITLLREMRTRGFGVIILTNRSFFLEEASKKWLDWYYVPYDILACVEDKQQYLVDVNLPVLGLIDDNPENLEGLPTVGMLWSQPWNVSESHFPRIVYDRERMRHLVNLPGQEIWQDFWENKK
jgi:5'(3')-deoxyribonucleotidase